MYFGRKEYIPYISLLRLYIPTDPDTHKGTFNFAVINLLNTIYNNKP